jgi:hypothetical protein
LSAAACGDDSNTPATNVSNNTSVASSSGAGASANSTGTATTSGNTTASSTSTASVAGGTGGSSGTTTNTTGSGMFSYSANIAPIFKDHCNDCHHQAVENIPNIADPFNPSNGLLVFPNTWFEQYPNTPAMNVVPGDPEQSFLMNKIADMSVQAGDFMPWSPARVTQEEIAALRQWVSDGALNDTFYQQSVQPIFGTAGLLGAPGGKCNYCHHASGILPNLSDPFDPINGVVGIAAAIRPYTRVVPGDPDNSLLIIKVEATEVGLHGEPMPMVYPPLTTAEVDAVRQWVIEGAQNN